MQDNTNSTLPQNNLSDLLNANNGVSNTPSVATVSTNPVSNSQTTDVVNPNLVSDVPSAPIQSNNTASQDQAMDLTSMQPIQNTAQITTPTMDSVSAQTPPSNTNPDLQSVSAPITPNFETITNPASVPAAAQTFPAPVINKIENTVSAEPSGESRLSSLFEAVPSEVVIPVPDRTPVSEQFVSEPIMTNTPIEVKTVEGLPPIEQVQSVNPLKMNKKGVDIGKIVRYAIWITIVIVGMISLFIGLYLANIVNIPFLELLIKR